MLEYLVDPGWDDVKQLTQSFHDCEAFRNKEGLTWLNIFMKKINRFSDERLESLIKRIHFEWQAALSGAASKRRAKPPRSSIQVFNQEAVSKAFTRMDEIKDEKKTGGDHILENAQFNNGYRTVPDVRKAWAKLEAEKSRFENLMEPIGRLQMDLLLAGAMKPEDFYITPILLLGDPGIGKTFLATQLADSLGVAMEKISAGGAQGGFQITGSHSTYLSARPGSLTAVLAAGTSASPVFVIDEVDKIVDGQHPVLPVLLDLFEPNTAKAFKDQFLELEYDASRVIFILTANTLDGVPLPLLSRVEVFDVPRPAPAQRLRIIQDEAEQLRRKTRKQIELDEGTSQILAERTDIDLRKTTRLVKEAFTQALLLGNTVAKLVIPKGVRQKSMGFCL